MSKIDEKIQAALRAEGAGGAPGGGEPHLRELVGDMFHGRLRWLNAFGYGLGVVFFGLTIFAAFRFYQAQEMRSMLTWGLVIAICFLSVGMLKIWFFLELQKNTILREIKRLELQVARLAPRPGAGE